MNKLQLSFGKKTVFSNCNLTNTVSFPRNVILTLGNIHGYHDHTQIDEYFSNSNNFIFKANDIRHYSFRC